MRVAFVVNNYPPRVGGVESHVASLARHLTAQGHRVFVYTLSDRPGQADEDGITVVRVRELFRVGDVLGFPVPGTSRRLRQALRRARIDVVSVHTRFFPLTWIGRAAAHRKGIPVIHTEHGSGYVVSESPVIALASRLVDLTLGRATLRGADVVLGVSENVLDFVQRLSGRTGQLFYNAIEAPRVDAARVIPDRPGHLVFVGRLVPGKGWDTFVDVVGDLRRSRHDITAEVLGDGPDMGKLRARVAETGCSEVIDVRGRVAAAEVRRSLAGATLVNPTLLAEGFQTTLLEAIAERGRIVTYSVPGAAVLRSQGAPVVATEDRTPQALEAALVQLLREPPRAAPSDFIEQWTWPTRARQFAEICARTIDGGGGGGGGGGGQESTVTRTR